MAAKALPKLYVHLKGENGCHSFTKALQQLGAEWAQPNTESPENEKTTQKKVTAHHYPERKHAKYRLKQEAWKWDTRTFNSDGLS